MPRVLSVKDQPITTLVLHRLVPNYFRCVFYDDKEFDLPMYMLVYTLHNNTTVLKSYMPKHCPNLPRAR